MEDDALSSLVQSFNSAKHLEGDLIAAAGARGKDLSGQKSDLVRHAVLRMGHLVDAANGNLIARFIGFLRGHRNFAFALPRRSRFTSRRKSCSSCNRMPSCATWVCFELWSAGRIGHATAAYHV